MPSPFLSIAASAAVVSAGIAGTSGVRAFEAMPTMTSFAADGEGGGAAGQCRVDVVRTGSGGTVTTTRTDAGDSCVCTVTTGPVGANGNAENVVTGILRDRTCAKATAVGEQVSEAAAAGGGSGAVIPALLGTLGAGGLGVALGAQSRG